MVAYKYKTYSKIQHCIVWLVEVWHATELLEEKEFSDEHEADQFVSGIYA